MNVSIPNAASDVPDVSAPGPIAASSPSMTRTEEALETENFIDTYQMIGEWIRFADTKAGVTLTVNGILLGLLVPTLKSYLTDKSVTHPTEWWTGLVLGLFLIWLGLLVISAVNAFLCILPFRGQGKQLALEKTTHFHPAAVSQHYSLDDMERFVNECDRMDPAGLKRQVIAAILIDSHVSSLKYQCVARAIWRLAASTVFGMLYLLAIQF